MGKLIRAALIVAIARLPAWADPAAAIPPYGWLQYCGQSRDPSCDLGRPLTPEDLAYVQAGIVGQFIPTEDPLDSWRAFPDDKTGDCEDYALSFRAALLSLGQPSNSMVIVIGKADTAEASGVHAVLEVQIGPDVWVLDSLTDHIYRPGAGPYQFTEEARQVPSQVKWRMAK
jgi:hypothetical protein